MGEWREQVTADAAGRSEADVGFAAALAWAIGRAEAGRGWGSSMDAQTGAERDHRGFGRDELSGGKVADLIDAVHARGVDIGVQP